MEINECVKGINWGKYKIEEKEIKTQYNGKTVFKIPYNKIVNSGVLNKNELVLDLQDDDVQDNEDALCEMRFYIPQQQQSEMKEEGDDEEEKESNAAELLNSEIVKNAKIGQFAGETIVTIPEIPLIIPRGKYTADFFQSLIRLHGITYDYKLEYKNIGKAFLLPKIDSVHMVIVLALLKPIRQGNTSHPYIVMQFKKDLEATIKIKLSEEQRKAQYGDVLKEEYSAPVYEIVSKMLKIIVGVNIIIPENFKSLYNQPGIRCAVKAQEGQLFPLKKSLIFITKPVIFTRLDEIALVEFHRTAQQYKMSDLSLKLKDKKEQITFVGIDRNEIDLLISYFQQKKVPTQKFEDAAHKFEEQYDLSSSDENSGPKKPKKKQSIDDEDDDEEEEDEDFNVADVKDSQSSSSSDQEEPDDDFEPHKVKKEK